MAGSYPAMMSTFLVKAIFCILFIVYLFCSKPNTDIKLGQKHSGSGCRE